LIDLQADGTDSQWQTRKLPRITLPMMVYSRPWVGKICMVASGQELSIHARPFNAPAL